MFTQTATYALRAMGFIAARYGNGPILSQTIAQEMEIPKNFLSKIMHQLVRANLVTSARGTNGGFELARDPSEITMLNVIAPFMDITAYKSCLLGRSNCDGSCKVHKLWKPIITDINEMLQNTTIDQVV